MNNRRLEYNPLFESITDSARRYQRISEDAVDPQYKKQAAVNYAKRIIRIVGDQINYFVMSIPSPTVRATTLKTLLEFLTTTASKTGITFEELFNTFVEEWNTLEKSIVSSSEMSKYEGIDEIYLKVANGMEKMKSAASLYIEKYPEDSKSGEVTTALSEMMKMVKQSIEQINKA